MFSSRGNPLFHQHSSQTTQRTLLTGSWAKQSVVPLYKKPFFWATNSLILGGGELKEKNGESLLCETGYLKRRDYQAKLLGFPDPMAGLPCSNGACYKVSRLQ